MSYAVRCSWLVSCACALLFACGDDEPADPVQRVDFCPGLALELCEGVRDCCMTSGDSLDACVATQSQRCERAVLLEGGFSVGGIEIDFGSGSVSDDGRIEFDPQAAGEVVAAARSAAKGCDALEYPSFSAVHDAVRVEGSSSEPCVGDDECDSEFYCADVTAAGRVGSCVRLPGRDQPCTGVCSEGLICFEADAGGVSSCVPARDDGESCDFDGDCERGLHCDRSVRFGRATCIANKATGDACEDDAQCTSAYCAGGTVCAQAPQEEPASTWCALE